ncbi:MAG: hypothetical protein ACR2IF_18605 [Terriglobales bacterium]
MHLPRIVPASSLEDRPQPAVVLTGIEELDALTGGLPRGALSEICGPASSGRSSVLLALMSAMTRNHEFCALVDASDSFDPQSAAAAGVDLRRVLWIRCSKKSVVEGRRSMAIIGKNAALGHRPSAIDSVEQALKATDLLLQGGGFGLVVVDLADIPAAAARRIPLTSWFRFRRAVEHTPAVLAMLEQEPYAKTCASVVLKLSAISSQFSARLQAAGCGLQENQPAHAKVLGGLRITAEVVRSAAQGKKPARSTAVWKSRTAWAG